MANGERSAAIAARLKEPSTWAGLAVLLSVFGLPAGLSEAVVQIGAGLGAAAAIVLREPGHR